MLFPITGVFSIFQATIPMLLSLEKVPPELKLEQAKGLNMMMLVLNTLTSFKHNTQTGLLSPLTRIITDPQSVKVHPLTTRVLSILDHVDTSANFTDKLSSDRIVYFWLNVISVSRWE